jgi:uncharacterized protein YkwD
MPKAPKATGRSLAIALLLGMTAAAVPPSARVLAASSIDSDRTQKPAQRATLKPAAATAPDIPFSDYDPDTEQQLLDLANQARSQASLPPLTLDAGMNRAARIHAKAMLAAGQLSHQFNDEPSLPKRLAAMTRTQLDQEGENVALDFNAAEANQHFMLSPPHRANLLNPAFNVIGLGVVRNGDQLYIVQDFGHALPNYSVTEVKDRIAATVEQVRHQSNQPDLTRRELPNADDAACSMAQADKLGTSPVHQLAQRYTVLIYTSLHPETLPANAGGALSAHSLHSFSVGVCYARTETYPTGVYWVVLSLE